jgi:hypothetical protein
MQMLLKFLFNSLPYCNCLHHHHLSNIHAHYCGTESEQQNNHLFAQCHCTQEQRPQLCYCKSLKTLINCSYFTSFLATHTYNIAYRASYNETDCSAAFTQLAYNSSQKHTQTVQSVVQTQQIEVNGSANILKESYCHGLLGHDGALKKDIGAQCRI